MNKEKKKILSYKEWKESVCLPHRVFDEDDYIKLYSQYYHRNMMERHINNLINCNTSFSDDQISAIKWESLNVPEMNKKLKKWRNL